MSMYAYWLANSGLTVHKLTGLMTEGIGAEELYALQESKMKKIRVLDEKDVEKITQSRRHWDVQEHWGKLQEEGIGFVCVEDARYPQKLRRISATPYALYYIGRLSEFLWYLPDTVFRKGSGCTVLLWLSDQKHQLLRHNLHEPDPCQN